MSFSLENAPGQKGRIAIVTGANIGLGFETAKGLAKKDAKVIMACRNEEKAKKAKADIESTIPNADLEIMILDLNDLDSVRRFANEYTEKYKRLDLLINNAGIMIPPLMRTKQGMESQMGVNYFAHFLLTNLLFDTIKETPGARIVTLSSNAHKSGEIDFENINAEKDYSRFGAYAMSKLACLMFAFELQRRLESAGSSVIAVSAHPGVSMTNLVQFVPGILQILLKPLAPIFTHDPEQGALPTLMAAIGEDVKGGEYLGPIGFNEMKGEPGRAKVKSIARDEQVAQKLWKVSEELTGEQFDVQ